jgi:hypothetical protein
VSDPGAVDELRTAQQASGVGKYGSTPVKPFVADPSKKGWIRIQLVDDHGRPVVGELYEIVLPDGETTASGTLDSRGAATVAGFDPGTCHVTFPNLDEASWKKR